MAITGQQLVTDALYGSGVLGADESLADSDAQLCLRRLNRLLDSWSNLRLMCYEVLTDSFTMTSGVASYSTTLLLTMGRPLNVDSMYVRLDSIDWPVDLISAEEWSEISYKPVTSVPRKCYPDMAYPNATFNFWPVPYAAFTCFVNAAKALPDTIALATNVSLPPGYERMLVDCLGVDICPSFGRQAPPELVQSAREAKTAIKRTNLVVPVMDIPFTDPPDPSNGFVYRGW